MKKILLFGGSGFLGQSIKQRYLSMGHAVVTAGRSPDSDIVIDFEKETFLDQISANYEFDMLIHAVAINEVFINDSLKNTYFINVTLTRFLVELAIKHEIKQFIYISTFHIYGKSSGKIDESTVPTPVNDYGVSHLLSENIVTNLCRVNNIDSLIVRPTNIFGMPQDIETFNRWSLVPFAFVKSAVEEGTIGLKSSGVQERNFVSIESVIDTFDLIGRTKIVNAVGVSTLSIFNFAKLVALITSELLSKEVIVTRIEEPIAQANELSVSSLYAPKESQGCLNRFVQDFTKVMIGHG